MSMNFYPNGPDSGWELAVPNPGYGEVIIFAPHELLDREWHLTLLGPEIGDFLAEITRRALDHNEPDAAARSHQQASTSVPPFVTGEVARSVLPLLQKAAILAAAGTDRYERTFSDESESPQNPLCTHCNEGTYFTPGAMPNKHCKEYGHAPYGYGAEVRWANAQAIHASRRVHWERRQALGLPAGSTGPFSGDA